MPKASNPGSPESSLATTRFAPISPQISSLRIPLYPPRRRPSWCSQCLGVLFGQTTEGLLLGPYVSTPIEKKLWTRFRCQTYPHGYNAFCGYHTVLEVSIKGGCSEAIRIQPLAESHDKVRLHLNNAEQGAS